MSNPVYVIKQKRLVNHVTATRQKILRIYSAHDMDARETADYSLISIKPWKVWHPPKMALTKTQVYYYLLLHNCQLYLDIKSTSQFIFILDTANFHDFISESSKLHE